MFVTYNYWTFAKHFSIHMWGYQSPSFYGWKWLFLYAVNKKLRVPIDDITNRNDLTILTDFNFPLICTGNGIHRLTDDGFASMPLLKVVMAGENALQSVEERTFQGLNRLETLDLHNNRLMTVHERALRDLRRLNHLNLQGNHLDSISPQLFRENTALRRLDLSWNQLTTIPESSLNDNRSASVAFNMLQQDNFKQNN